MAVAGLSLACRVSRCQLTTFEILAKKVELARRTFADAELDDLVKVIEADGRRAICHLDDIGFCFLDTTSDAYDDIHAAVVPKLAPGGILVTDNAISHHHEISHVVEKAFSDKRVDALIVPIGKGVLVCRRIGNS